MFRLEDIGCFNCDL